MPIPQLQSSSSWRAAAERRRRATEQFRYSRNNRFGGRGPNKKVGFFGGLLLLLSAAILAGSVAASGFFIWIEHSLPDPANLMERAVAQSTKIYDRTGKTVLYEIHGAQKRTLIDLKDVPEAVKWATIAIEDKNFYEHGGFDLRGIARAIFVNLTKGGKVQGGSTITQQLIKNSILSKEKTYSRKLKELILAWKLESRLSKDQILELYLNEIPYGSTSYGIESAAETFFGKKTPELSASEATLLTALPKAPTYYSPYGNHKDELLARSRHILDEMVQIGKMTKEEAEKAKADNPLERILPRREAIIAPHFVLYIKELLTEKYGERLVEQGGLKVITTLDLDKQKFAEEAITAQGAENEKKWGAGNAALVSLDPQTGQILAMVGSRDYFDDTHDGNVNVTIRPRQPGSSFKPIVYAASFLKGFTPTTILYDVNTIFKTEIGEDYEPKNYDLKEHGPVTVRQALAGSLNIPAVKMIYLTGVKNVLDLADKIGYTTLKERSRFGLSLVLGGGEVKLLEHTSAFGVFASLGTKHTISPLLKVEESSGTVLEEWVDEKEEVFPTQIAHQISNILSDNDARSFIFGAQNFLTLPGRAVAAKTGTTNDYHDAWTIGYTPELVTGVWVGNNNNSEMKRGADGSKIAAPIWNAYMRKALQNTPPSFFSAPEAVVTGKPVLDGNPYNTLKIRINRATGLLADENVSEDQVETREYRQVHNILHYINKNDPRGAPPTEPQSDPQYENWETGVKNWATTNGIITELPPEVTASLLEEATSQPVLQPPVTEINREENVTQDVTVLGFSAVKWKSPKNNKQLSAEMFPFTIIASLTDQNFTEAELIVESKNNNFSLGLAQKEENGNYRWFWSEYPPKEDYLLRIKINFQGKKFYLEPPITVSAQ